ncbi:hypothetical protein SEA_PSONYX_83 [Corynebacterium phage PSonyx]|nr:hypothetical protein SEA_PSONYX_83 [Corynebacterium phage PSonyx]
MTTHTQQINATITFTTTHQLHPDTPLDDYEAIQNDINTKQPHLKNHVSYIHTNGRTATVEHEEEITFKGSVFDHTLTFTELAKRHIAETHGQQCADNIIKYEQN